MKQELYNIILKDDLEELKQKLSQKQVGVSDLEEMGALATAIVEGSEKIQEYLLENKIS